MATATQPLTAFAKVIRSKNSGPFELTFDVMFDEDAPYLFVKRSGVINVENVAAAYSIMASDVLVCTAFDAARAFKITIKRPVSSGDLMDRDVYGCQQHVPLTRLQIPA
ncbi:DUF4387 domain-containing protein [Bordetella genomosp. 13]|uniref:DUF4387 domain-containing protein n=1 Tax=Bordetella genomosp. 13 TaxID=463040 RepID=A0A1W6ZGQ9_9BORD|nr:DUF4387 domain-containing protein [Bordetella genomosp. 13]ARP96593.1 hypothetical protein CAL15_20845 [Bordetella genomosp. 13]